MSLAAEDRPGAHSMLGTTLESFLHGTLGDLIIIDSNKKDKVFICFKMLLILLPSFHPQSSAFFRWDREIRRK